MLTMLRPKFQHSLNLALFLLVFFHASQAPAQTIRNGEFDEGTTWWLGFGASQIESSTDSYLSGSAIAVSQREQYWNGLAQNLDGQLEAGTDYHFQARIKLAEGESGTMRVVLYQTDDRGERVLKLGEVFCGPDQWTQIQGAFTYDPHGPVQSLSLVVDNSDTDRRTYDFLVDSVTLTENDWLDAANARIEEIRKRDAMLSFVRSNGLPATGLEVTAVQVTHAFPFGAALNDAVLTNPVYEDFFKSHFDWATIEWFAQWKPVELVPGVEDYSIADATIDFCEQNGIKVKGHALFWGQDEFRPTWLDDLGEVELQQAMETRLTSAVTRFGSRLIGWDVNNEMLDHEWFLDQIGDTVRPWMFSRARELNSDITLFLNEYGTEESEAKTVRYRKLADSLIESGASVGGVGFQSHFDGMASPKGIEIAIDQFQDSGLPIWFTEYDSVHPDPDRRADSLENFYRYAFSRPESHGITMWGFWAGTHWLGPDASIVDLDWTVNAAGQRYFALMDEWSTEAEGTSDGSGQFEFRGFHGSYLISTTDGTGIVNHHLFPLNAGDGLANVVLTATPFNESLTVHGTVEDDVFEYDMSSPNFLQINGSRVVLDANLNLTDLRFEGVGGNDRVVIKTSADSQSFFVNADRLLDRGTKSVIRFDNVAVVEISATAEASQVTVADSRGDDIFDSFADVSTLTTDDRQVSFVGFQRVLAFSNFGDDTANLYDNPGDDLVVTNMVAVNIQQDEMIRQASGFKEFNVVSESGLDRLEVRGSEQRSIEVSPTSIHITPGLDDSRQFHFASIPKATFFAEESNADTVTVVGDDSDETIRIAPNGSVYFGAGFNYVFARHFRSFESSTDSPGNDRVIFRDTEADETLIASGDQLEITGGGSSHSFQFIDSVFAFSRAGGLDSASVDSATGEIHLIGDWNSDE